MDDSIRSLFSHGARLRDIQRCYQRNSPDRLRTDSEPTPAQFGREIAVFLVLLVSSFVTATVARVSIPADGIRFTVSWQPVKESESLPPIPKAED